MDSGVYRVELDGRWSLRDLYEFPRAYMQVYAFAYAFDTEHPAVDADRINYALDSYPWGGGYSIVNMYSVLQSQISPRSRPVIKEIRYASPGWIDLILHLHPAVKVAGAVATIAGSIAGTAKAYASVQDVLYKISARSKEARVQSIQLTRLEIEELQKLNKALASAMEFSDIEALEMRTNNSHVTAKLLSAQYRRLRQLASFANKGKARLPLGTSELSPSSPKLPQVDD